MFCINDIINTKSLKIRFQPIVSIQKNAVTGFEALCFAEYQGKYISPDELFKQAKIENKLLEFDRHCREEAMICFSTFSNASDYLLFLNFESSLIDCANANMDYILNQCKRNGIPPELVVIELIESKITNEDTLIQFVDFYRKHGFFLAIDDFGEGYSNLNRVVQIHPDIIKVDKSLVTNLESNTIKEQIVFSLAALAHRIGALLLLEGVGTEATCIKAARMGAELLQGYYLSKPGADIATVLRQAEQQTKNMTEDAKYITATEIREERDLQKSSIDSIRNCLLNLLDNDSNNFEHILHQYCETTKNCECAYILGKDGIQISSTFFPEIVKKAIRFSKLFYPAKKGTDHSMKSYFYMPAMSMSPYVTRPYISNATGTFCITVSFPFSINETTFFFCADFPFSSCGKNAEVLVNEKG